MKIIQIAQLQEIKAQVEAGANDHDISHMIREVRQGVNNEVLGAKLEEIESQTKQGTSKTDLLQMMNEVLSDLRQ